MAHDPTTRRETAGGDQASKLRQECARAGAAERAEQTPTPRGPFEELSLSDDLRRWLDGQPAQTHQLTDFDQLWAVCHRRPWATTAAITTCVALVAVTMFSFAGLLATAWRLVECQRALSDGEQSRLLAAAAAENTEARMHAALEEAAAAIDAQTATAELLNEAEARRQELELAARLTSEKLDRAERELRAVAAARLTKESTGSRSADPQSSLLLAREALLASAAGQEAPPNEAVQSLRDALGAQGARTFEGHTRTIASLAFTRDARELVTAALDNTVRLWPLDTSKSRAVTVLSRHRAAVEAFVLSADGESLVTGSHDGTLAVWNLDAEDVAGSAQALEVGGARVRALTLSQDGRWLAAGCAGIDGDACSARLWDLSRKDAAHKPIVLGPHSRPITDIAISRDSQWLATASEDEIALVWNINAIGSGARPKRLVGHQSRVVALDISPDGQRLATASHDGTARVWDLSAADPAASCVSLTGHAGRVNEVRFTTDANHLATISDDGAARLWYVHADGRTFDSRVLEGHSAAVKALTLSQDHRQLATGGDDGKILLWDAVGGSAEPTARFACEGARITSLAISDDGRWLAAASEAVSGSAQPAVRVWPLLVEDLIAVSDQAAERGLTPVEYERLDIPLMGQAETTTR